ncbi:MAG: lysozyme inhibitor LprI family protein [Smithella sp.]
MAVFRFPLDISYHGCLRNRQTIKLWTDKEMIYKIRMGYFLLALALFVTTCSIAFAEEVKHKIDIELYACIGKTASETERFKCYSIAYDKWDKKLEVVYNVLMNKLDGQVYLGLMKKFADIGEKNHTQYLELEKKFNQNRDQMELKETQLSWLLYRNKQEKLLAGSILQIESGINVRRAR